MSAGVLRERTVCKTNGSKLEPDILILGASGQVGQELQRQLPPERVISRAREMVNVTNHAMVRNFIEAVKPRIVINAASTNVYRSVPSPDEHWRVNAMAVDNLVKVCAINRVALIQLSTSDVFGRSDHDRPHVELDPIGPIGEYSASKAAGEHSVLSVGNFPCPEFVDFKYWLIRTSCLFARPRDHGLNFLQLTLDSMMRSRSPREIPTDVFRSATYVPHLAQQLVWLADNYLGVPSGIYHIANAGAPSLYDLVRETRRYVSDRNSAPLLEGKRDQFAKDANLAKQEVPKNGLLDCSAWDNISPIPLKPWEQAVREFSREYR